jgi:AraC-like DNA-binding protein
MVELTELVARIERHAPSDGAYDTAVTALRLYRASAPTPLYAFVYEPSLCIVAQGSKEVLLGGEKYRHDPANSILVSVDLPVSARVVEASARHPCLMIRITLDPVVVGDLVADGVAIHSSGPVSCGLAVTPLPIPLLDAVKRLVALLDSAQDVRPLAPLVLREITYRVLVGPHGARLRQIATAGAPAQQIAQSIRWLREHFADPLRGEALARKAQMSLSGFHQHFKAVTGLSPLQYQKQLRLQEARRLMLGEGLDAAAAAFRVGYESPSQFSREFRRLFGTPPRRSVAALKTVRETAG